MRGWACWLRALLLAWLCVSPVGAQQAGDAVSSWLEGLAARTPAVADWEERQREQPQLLADVVRLSVEGSPGARAGAGNLLSAMASAEPEALGRDLAALVQAGAPGALARLDAIAGQRRAVVEFCRGALTTRVDLGRRLEAARRLGEVRAQASQRALESLWREGELVSRAIEQRWIECVVIVALLRLGVQPPVEPAPSLLAAAVIDDPELAAHGLEGLRSLPTAGLRQPLLQAIQGGESVTRLRAIALCPQLELDLSAELSEVGEDTTEPLPVRQAAVRALGLLGRTRSARPLIALLEDAGQTPVGLRREAAQALGRLGPSLAGREALERALLDDESAIRRWALRSLARYGQPESQAALRELVRQRPAAESAEEWRARAEAFQRVGVTDAESVRAMLRLTGEETPALLQDLLDYAGTLAEDLAVPFLLDLLGAPHELARRQAARELHRRAGRADHGLDRQAWRSWWQARQRE